jgi:hypothetical protein
MEASAASSLLVACHQFMIRSRWSTNSASGWGFVAMSASCSPSGHRALLRLAESTLRSKYLLFNSATHPPTPSQQAQTPYFPKRNRYTAKACLRTSQAKRLTKECRSLSRVDRMISEPELRYWIGKCTGTPCGKLPVRSIQLCIKFQFFYTQNELPFQCKNSNSAWLLHSRALSLLHQQWKIGWRSHTIQAPKPRCQSNAQACYSPRC